MRYTDVAVIGGGLSGSAAAAMPGRVGISAVLIDPHESYPADFRVEKLSGHVQIERFLKTGIGESVLRRATFAGENWIARFGRLLHKAPSRLFNIRYDCLVNAVRDEISAGVARIISVFPIGTRMRANLFVYRSFDDPWLRELRRTPGETLNAACPGSSASPAARRGIASGAELPRSLLVVLVLIILVEIVVVLAVVISLSHRAMRLVGLVVPQLAIGAVLGEQLGMRAALDRPAP